MQSPTGISKRRKRGFIYWAKIALPIFIFVLVVGVIVWSRIQLRETRIDVQELKLTSGQSDANAEKGEGLNAQKVLYDGKDDRGRPYHIAASGAEAVGADYRLTKPEGDINLKEEEWAALRSDKGYYWAERKVIDFMGNVVLFRNDGMVFETEEASMDIKTGDFTGQKPVKGGDSSLEVQSEEGFQILEDGNHILFLGRSHAIIHSDKENEAPK